MSRSFTDMQSKHTGCLKVLLVLSLTIATGAYGQTVSDEINKYREMLKEANPAELLELQGEEIWQSKRGPKNVSLAQCDLGLGPGVLDGAYAQLPRFFADTGRVQDAESRLVTCMMNLQGLSLPEATQDWYRSGSDMEALITYVATRSRGSVISVPATHPAEKRMYAVGEALFFRRAGPLDFSCATCHGQDDKRIRLQELPNLTTKDGAQSSMKEWPAYRVSQGSVWTMERRLIDCLRQMRFPDADFLSDVVVALQVYMQKNATGVVLEAPGIKR